jgi:aminocarboxymuconate-semialdehyde decarboxylase
MAANTLIADTCRDHPQRFVGLGLVALQFQDVAARQLEDGMCSMGMRGVEIGTRVNDMELDDERLEPFRAAAEQHRALDTTIALTHLIFGSVLERHPGLKIVGEMVYAPANLAHLIREMGASQVVLGTDYPYDMGEEHPLDLLKAVDSLSEDDRGRIMRGNALELLGLPA